MHQDKSVAAAGVPEQAPSNVARVGMGKSPAVVRKRGNATDGALVPPPWTDKKAVDAGEEHEQLAARTPPDAPRLANDESTAEEQTTVPATSLSATPLAGVVAVSGWLSALAYIQAGANMSLTPVGHSGWVIDSYLSGSTVRRANGSGNTVVTDKNGRFDGLTGTGEIIAEGGIDVSTKQPFVGKMTAPEGATVITPLTTLIVKLEKLGLAREDAMAKVSTLAGLDAAPP